MVCAQQVEACGGRGGIGGLCLGCVGVLGARVMERGTTTDPHPVPVNLLPITAHTRASTHLVHPVHPPQHRPHIPMHTSPRTPRTPPTRAPLPPCSPPFPPPLPSAPLTLALTPPLSPRPRYAYGDRGDAPPGFAPGDGVEWEIELVAFEREGHWQAMKFEERFDLVERVKAKVGGGGVVGV